MNRKKIISCIVWLCATASTPVPATVAYQSHASIRWAVKNFVLKNVVSQQGNNSEITVGKLDSRLNLKKCNKYLQAYLPKGSRDTGRTTVGVKCTGSTPWSLHVPVTISIYKNILVAARQLHKDKVLTITDIKLEKHDLADLSYGYLDDKDSVIGMKLKRRASAGAVLTPAMVKKPTIVSRGQNITIVAQSARMSVSMMGKALDSGAVGDRIKIINLKSGKKLEGVITASGEVEVGI